MQRIPLDIEWLEFGISRRAVDVPLAPSMTYKTLSQAIVNILNNAADAAPAHIEIDARWIDEALTMEIRDRGPGLSEAVPAIRVHQHLSNALTQQPSSPPLCGGVVTSNDHL